MLFDTFTLVYGSILLLLFIFFAVHSSIIRKKYSVFKYNVTEIKFKKWFKDNNDVSMFIAGVLSIIVFYLIGRFLFKTAPINLFVVTVPILLFVVLFAWYERKYESLINANKYSNTGHKERKNLYNKTDNNSETKTEKDAIIKAYIGLIIFILASIVYLLDALKVFHLQIWLIGATAPMGILLLFDVLKYLILALGIILIGQSTYVIINNYLNGDDDKDDDIKTKSKGVK